MIIPLFLINLNYPPWLYRRYNHNISFLTNLISGTIDSPSLLSLVNFKAPSRFTRQNTLFHVPFCSTNYISNEPINRIMQLANKDPSFLNI